MLDNNSNRDFWFFAHRVRSLFFKLGEQAPHRGGGHVPHLGEADMSLMAKSYAR